MMFKLNTFDLVLFLGHLRILLQKNYSVSKAVDLLAGQPYSERFKTYLVSVQRDLTTGVSISDALFNKKHPFPKNMERCIREMPQKDHDLGLTIKSLEETYKIHAKATVSIKSPAVDKAFIMAAIIIPILVVLSVTPLFNILFQNYGRELPLSTNAFFVFCRFFLRYWPISMILLITGAYFTAVQINKGKMYSFYLVYFFSIVSGQARTHAGLGQALFWAAHSIDDKLLKRRIKMLQDALENGRTFAEAVINSGNFPKLIGDLLDLGEKKGDLTSSLTAIINHYSLQMQKDLKKWNQALFIFNVLVIGTAVGVIYLPIFRMGGFFSTM